MKFDVILNMEVVEHVADRAAFLGACCELLAEDGLMFIATLNRTAKAFALAVVGAEYVLGWLPRGTHDWRKFVRPSELAAGLRPHGLEFAEIAGVSYSPLTRQMVAVARPRRELHGGGEEAVSRERRAVSVPPGHSLPIPHYASYRAAAARGCGRTRRPRR